jgi:hypothetical protein
LSRETVVRKNGPVSMLNDGEDIVVVLVSGISCPRHDKDRGNRSEK